MPDMSTDREAQDEVVTGFVVMKIREWRDAGHLLKDLAAAGRGMAASVPSQVLAGKMGVGSRSAPRFAKAFKYHDVDALKAAAYAWWAESGRGGSAAIDVPMTAAQGEAVETILGLGLAKRDQLKVIMAAYTHPRFRDRDAHWWIETLLQELKEDRRALELDSLTRKGVRATQKEMRQARARGAAAVAAANARPNPKHKAG